MEIKKFIENVADQFDETDVAVFTPETEFKELDEYSSLVALSLIAMIDDEYDVTLKGDDMRNTSTVEELYNLVKSRM